jgi:3-deoxy-7-phosphoheptulonate synthase
MKPQDPTASHPYPLAGLTEAGRRSTVKVGSAVFGPGYLTVIAGPCAVESEAQTLRIALAVKEAGAKALRGGAFKPRTSPYSFQGLGRDGLVILKKARELTGLPVITEAVDEQSLEWVVEAADAVQIGARNMQNFSLLQRVGRCGKPVLLKRGLSATVDEWLQAAEYVLSEGNPDVILCERGVRSIDPHARTLLDLAAVVALRTARAGAKW